MGWSVCPTGGFIVMVRYVIRRSLASGESSVRSLASGPQPAHVTTECDRLVKQCVVLARLCSALESILSARNSWAGQFCRQLRSIDVFQHVNVKLNAIFCLLWRQQHRVGGGIATSSNLFSESALNSTKTSSPMRAAVAWDNYLPSAEHSWSGTPLRLIYRACEEVRGWVLARLCSALESILSTRNSWAGQFCRQLRSIDVFQHVNVKLNATFCLLWREQHCVGGGSTTSSNLFSESALNLTARWAF